jgi:hypothetical protein
MDRCSGRRWEEADECKDLEENSAGERGKKGLDKGGQGPISGCCAIEEDHIQELNNVTEALQILSLFLH